jgi:multidrug resistance efflux pump
MSSDKPQILYSDPVNEIISRPPKGIIRLGTTVIFVIFTFLLVLSWIIKYPDVILAPIEITTINPPVTLVSKVTGRINAIYVKDGEKVQADKVLAVMETAASIDQINEIRKTIDSTNIPSSLNYNTLPRLSDLGELQPWYATFLKVLSDYDTYVKNDYYGNKIIAVKNETSVLEGFIKRLSAKEKLIFENLRLEERQFRRDSSLYAQKVYTDSQFEKSKQTLNGVKLDLQQVKLDQSQASLSLSEKNQILRDYELSKTRETQSLGALLEEAFQNLKAQTRIWENKYLLITPVAGTISFTKIWSGNQSVTADQPVMTVVPESPGNFIGRITLKMNRSGKVEPGMKVNIKLSGYPYLEYGMIRGVVKTKSLVASGDAYIIEVSLPSELTTLYGQKLGVTQDMQGQAEIITEDLRLIQRIINPFRYMISRNRS